MIVGIGNDCIEINRIEKACKKDNFRERCFTKEEIAQSKGRSSYFAGNFAVKEAVVKCLGTGFRGIKLTDIEVLRNKLGKPYVNIYGKAKELSDTLNISDFFVTITNTSDLAIAVAVAETRSIHM